MRLLLERWRIPYLAFVAGITLFLGYACFDLEVDRENRLMDADNASQTEIEKTFNALFAEGDSVLIAVRRENILDSVGKALLGDLVSGLRKIEGVKTVESVADNDFTPLPFQEGLLISPDRTTAGIRLLLDSFTDNGEGLERTIEGIRSVMAPFASDTTRLAATGLPLQKFESGRLVLRDQRLFAPLSFLVLGVVLYFITGRRSGMILPLLVAGITICWTLGLYALLGYRLNMITSLLPPVIMTLSVATTIHVYMEWLHGSDPDNGERILKAVRLVYRPCLFAAITTMIGFLSLFISHTPAVRLFGLFAAFGVGVSFLIGVSGLAVGLSFFKNPPLNPNPGKSTTERYRFTDALSSLAINHPRRILAVTAVLAGISLFGLRQIESDTNLLNFLGAKTELYRDTKFIGKHLTGPNSIELLITRADGAPIQDFAEVEKIQAFQRAIGNLTHVRHSLSPADFLLSEEVRPWRNKAPLAVIAGNIDLSAYLSGDLRFSRLTLRTDAIGSMEGEKLIGQVRSIAAEKLGDTFTVKEVGEFYRVIVESNQLTASQLKSFGMALVLILLSIGIVFQSLKYTLIAIIPNVVPLLITAAVMGFFDIDLSTGTTMIASIVLGIAVDDTIHYISAFRRTFRGDVDASLRETTGSTGFTLIATTVALSSGFCIAIFGSFQPTIHFAFLSVLTMWFALACDLIVLPACLKLTFLKSEGTHSS